MAGMNPAMTAQRFRMGFCRIFSSEIACLFLSCPGLVPGIHVFLSNKGKSRNGRNTSAKARFALFVRP
jgi:hypothetical protein